MMNFFVPYVVVALPPTIAAPEFGESLPKLLETVAFVAGTRRHIRHIRPLFFLLNPLVRFLVQPKSGATKSCSVM